MAAPLTGASGSDSPAAASRLAIAGRIYFADEDGVTTVIAVGPEFKVVARNALDGAVLASPAIARGSIVLRAATSNTASTVYRVQAGLLETSHATAQRPATPSAPGWRHSSDSG